jgi:hypothetical protein
MKYRTRNAAKSDSLQFDVSFESCPVFNFAKANMTIACAGVLVLHHTVNHHALGSFANASHMVDKIWNGPVNCAVLHCLESFHGPIFRAGLTFYSKQLVDVIVVSFMTFFERSLP